jgi:two-component system response regulator FixJ
MTKGEVIHVIDDDVGVRKSLGFLLASDGFAVRLHESAERFLAEVGDPGAGCVVTDVRMPGVDGLQFMVRLRELGSRVPVIVMTGHADVPLAVEAMKRGAVDFIEKPFDDVVLLTAIQSALGRQHGLAQAGAHAAEIHERIASLSERERQVLDGLVAGKANKVIGYDLDISPRTVEIYRANVMAKMKATSLSELVRLAMQSGSAP